MTVTVPPADLAGSRHQTNRVRHENRRRTLTVVKVDRLTPLMQRIEFTSVDLADFVSQAADDHVKLLFPVFDDRGEPKFEMRDYTPRSFVASECRLTIDFALHRAGPATAWALAAAPGASLEMAGPRGSSIVTDDFDWYLFIGDETALPAVGRRLEELRAGASVITAIYVDSDAERQEFDTQALLSQYWVVRDRVLAEPANALRDALGSIKFPTGEGYVWIAGELKLARSLRKYMIENRDHPKAWIKAAAYWARGESAAHEIIADDP
jgi:NADPH-dependent ferric siderophore reductase